MRSSVFFRAACWLAGVGVSLLGGCAVYKISPPTITQLSPEPPVFMVAAPLKYAARDGSQIIVPIGFITDLASIPRTLWVWQAPHEASMGPAVLHDYLYWDQSCTREEADALIYVTLLEAGMSKASAFLVYKGVDEFGGVAWKKNEAARSKGESRFLKPSYAHDLQDRWMTPKKTLAELQKDAEKMSGLAYPPRDQRTKAACTAALKEFKALRDS